MKKTFHIAKVIATAFFVLITIKVNSQASIKSATLIPFIDLNNNCIKDPGENLIANKGNFNIPIKKIDFVSQCCNNNNQPWDYHDSFPYSCSDSIFKFFYFLNPSLASSINTFDIYTDQLDAYLQPCFNPNNISFNTVTYVPFKSTFIGNEIHIDCKWITANPANGGNSYQVSQNGSICSGDIISTFLWPIQATCPNATLLSTSAVNTITLKSDGVTIDTYTYNMNFSSWFNLIGTNSQITCSGSGPGNFSWATYYFPNVTNPYTIGTHTLTLIHSPIFGLTQNIVSDYVFNIVNNCSQVVGNTFIDCNNDCVKQINEPNANNNMSHITLSNSISQISIYPDINGNFSMSSVGPGSYTLTGVAAPNYSICSVLPSTISIGSSTVHTINYGIKQTSVTPEDYSIYHNLSGANPGPGAVPGGTITVNAYYSTIGGDPCLNSVYPTKVKVVLPPLMSFGNVVTSTPPPSSVIPTPSGDTIIWNNPLLVGSYKFTAVTATNAVIGTSYCIKSLIYPLNDADVSNNLFTVCRTYGGPFDPNDKTSEAQNMSSNGNILPNTTDMTYTIRFQNLGNGPAVNVNIKDTIDANLNLSTLQILASSFPVQTQVNSVTKIIDFKFKDIYLPASSVNEPGSHGFVRYKINLNSSLPLGTQIKNRAHIYFDYNSAVVTNQTINTISIITGINESEFAKTISVYPNPTSKQININSQVTIKNVLVLNSMGQLILTKEYNTNNASVDVERLGTGIYFLQVETEQGTLTKKIIKQ